ncbi:hypothetical protein L541_4888 [Bordetella hinzii CA90 BAL1384]|nr:hypothetical protein L541_4888 [Bordetella hinzii CA90 BAL1384]
MAKICSLRVRFSWWVNPYLAGVRLFAIMTGREPNYQRVARVVERGIYIKAE